MLRYSTSVQSLGNLVRAESSWVEKGFVAIGIKPIQGFTSGALNGSAYLLEYQCG